MTRHAQASSAIQVSYRTPDRPGEQRITFGHDARLDGSAVADALSSRIPSIAADLLEVAAAVYVIDRCVPRQNDKGPDAAEHWGRKIAVRIPVRHPSRWINAAAPLHELLYWLTDDTWDVEFVENPSAAGLAAEQGFLFQTIPGDQVPTLFSGGLDSAAGLAILLQVTDAVAVSVATNPTMTHVQDRVVRQLRRDLNRKITHLTYRVNLRGVESKDSSQRTRGFLFLSVGVATAWATGRQSFEFLENGIGAINLAYIRSQIGAHATKSAHPRTIALMIDLVQKLSDNNFAINTPHFAMTKAELIAAAPQEAATALRLTVSCDTGFSARIAGRPPCGVCTSCLLRRQAVMASGRNNIDDLQNYRNEPANNSKTITAMLWQAFRFTACLRQPDPWSSLLDEFPDLVYVAGLMEPSDVVRLYRAYCDEWRTLAGSLGVDETLWLDQGEREHHG